LPQSNDFAYLFKKDMNLNQINNILTGAFLQNRVVQASGPVEGYSLPESDYGGGRPLGKRYRPNRMIHPGFSDGSQGIKRKRRRTTYVHPLQKKAHDFMVNPHANLLKKINNEATLQQQKEMVNDFLAGAPSGYRKSGRGRNVVFTPKNVKQKDVPMSTGVPDPISTGVPDRTRSKVDVAPEPQKLDFSEPAAPMETVSMETDDLLDQSRIDEEQHRRLAMDTPFATGRTLEEGEIRDVPPPPPAEMELEEGEIFETPAEKIREFKPSRIQSDFANRGVSIREDQRRRLREEALHRRRAEVAPMDEDSPIPVTSVDQGAVAIEEDSPIPVTSVDQGAVAMEEDSPIPVTSVDQGAVAMEEDSPIPVASVDQGAVAMEEDLPQIPVVPRPIRRQPQPIPVKSVDQGAVAMEEDMPKLDLPKQPEARREFKAKGPSKVKKRLGIQSRRGMRRKQREADLQQLRDRPIPIKSVDQGAVTMQDLPQLPQIPVVSRPPRSRIPVVSRPVRRQEPPPIPVKSVDQGAVEVKTRRQKQRVTETERPLLEPEPKDVSVLRERMQALGFDEPKVRPFTKVKRAKRRRERKIVDERPPRPIQRPEPPKVPEPKKPEPPKPKKIEKPKRKKLESSRSSVSFRVPKVDSPPRAPWRKKKPKPEPPKPPKPEKPAPKVEKQKTIIKEKIVYRDRGVSGSGRNDMKVAPTQQVSVSAPTSQGQAGRNAALEEKIDELLRQNKEKSRKGEQKKAFVAAKKQYRAYRKQKLAEMKKQHKEIKKREMAKIKSAPKNKRASMKKELNSKLKERENALKKRLPSKIATPGQLRELLSKK